MKRLLVAMLAATAFCVSAFRWLEEAPRDFLAALELGRDDAERFVFQSFWSDYVSHPTGARVKAVAMGDRPAMVQEVVQFARAYFASPQFLEAYLKIREETRPAPPTGPSSGEEMLQLMKAEMQKQIAELEAQIREATPDVKAILQETLAMMKEQQAELDDPDHPYRSPEMSAVLAEGAALEKEDYQKRLAEWEGLYPEDPTPRIAIRLEAIMAACADVDFSAQLVDGDGGKKLFASTVYERKPAEWKACYRAGPEAVDAARSALGAWLAEIR